MIHTPLSAPPLFVTRVPLLAGLVFVGILLTALATLYWQDHRHHLRTLPILEIHQPAILLTTNIPPQLNRLRDLLSLMEEGSPLDAQHPLTAMLQATFASIENDLNAIERLHRQLAGPDRFTAATRQAVVQLHALLQLLPDGHQPQKSRSAHEFLSPVQRLRNTVVQVQRLHRQAIDTLKAEVDSGWLSLGPGVTWVLALLLGLFLALAVVLQRQWSAMVRQLQSARAQADAAQRATQRANMGKNLLLANMSHEIRTPLNTILGMVEMLRDAGLSREHQHYLGLTHAAGENLLALVNNILDMAKMEAGHLLLEERYFDLGQIVENIENIMVLRLQGKEVATQCLLAEGTPKFLIGDAGRLFQILFNLTANGIKFTEKGHVTVTIAPLPAADSTTCRLSFKIEDSGVGMDEHRLSTLFQLENHDQPAHQSPEGAGVGLFLCRRLAEKMGGELRVASQSGVGSTFELVLPFRLPDQTDNPFELLRVLLIQSDNRLRVRLVELLRSMGCKEVLVASDGHGGLALFRQGCITGPSLGLVILECGLSDMEWMRIGGEIRLLSPAIPLVLIPHGQCSADILQQAAVSISATLGHPITRESLAETLRLALNSAVVVFHPPQPPGHSQERGSAERPWRILTVDDSEDSILLVQAYLREKHFRVDAAASGGGALEKLRFNQYDLIFMDMQMPGMDGLETTRRFRKWEMERQGGKTPVVALTAHALGFDEQQAFAAGCDLYLTKPIRKQELLAVIDKVLPSR